nr:MAG: hypothetical protein [Bacteriophage sp.]
MSIDEQNVNAPDEGTESSTVVDNGVTTITLDPNDPHPVETVEHLKESFRAAEENSSSAEVTVTADSLTIDAAKVLTVDGVDTAGQETAVSDLSDVFKPDAAADAEVIRAELAALSTSEDDAGLTDEDKEMVTLELTPQDFMIRMLGIDLAMAQIYPEPVYLATEADAADLLAREGLQYSFDSNRSLYLCGLADAFIEATLKDPDLRVLALRAIKFKYRRFDQPVEEAVKAVTTALRKQQHDIAAAQAAEAAAHMATDGAEQPQP